MAERRRTFAPVVLVGLAAAALSAVAGSRAWVDLVDGGLPAEPGGPTISVFAGTSGESPLAGALALVVLACWGVVLVTRGRFRRGVAVLAAVAGIGLAVTTLSAPWTLRHDLRAEIERLVGDAASVELTAWWWTSALASAVVVVTTVLAVVVTPHWPEMGARYDAPAGAPDARRDPETGIDMWKALDEGRDPTT